MADRLFLFDGTAFAYRSFFAIRAALSDSKGRPTNAAYGFTRVLMKILREEEFSHIVVVFDAAGKTFREELYPDYKATRRETPSDLVQQFPLIDMVLEAFNIPILRVRNVEADDVMGTLARRAEAAGMETVLVTSDKDLLQLVTDHVVAYDPAKGETGAWYRAAEVRERFGCGPEHVVDALGLMGDTADNVPGIRGIGEKTAKKLLEKHCSLEEIYEHLDETKGKLRERLESGRDIAFLSRRLATIDTAVDVEFDFASCRRREPDPARLAAVFAELEFQTLLEKYLPDAGEHEDLRYVHVYTPEQLDEVIGRLRSAGEFAVDTETTSTDPMRAELVGISLSCEAERAWYVAIGHTCEIPGLWEELGGADAPRGPLQIDRDTALEKLRPLLEDAAVGKTGHNIKYDLIVFRRAGIRLRGITMDTMVASYLTDPSRLRHNLSEVSLQYLKRKMIPITDLIGKGSKAVTFDQVPIDRACEYACEDADIAWRLAGVFRGLLRERAVDSLYRDVELPLIGVLARMEMAGITIDTAVFERLYDEIAVRLKALEAEIHEMAGEPFQINSPKQLQAILFEKIGLAPRRKTKTGFSTNVDVLEELALEHPLPKLILEYRMLEKMRGTYVEALPKLVHPETGRIHTSFNQAVAATGRLSSSDPNLQNIPVRTEIGRRIREGFIPAENWRLISADYSQIELRVLAHLSGDAGLREAFEQDADIHRDTAARIFRVAPESVTPEMRRQAKAVNFGVIYGISPFGLARNIGISQSEAARFIDNYFEQYPGVAEWIAATLEKARKAGYVTTVLNRRRYIPEINSSEFMPRKAAERVAMNTPVQGSAADIIKLAMLELDGELSKREPRLLLQVHDELLVESPADEAEETAALAKSVMEGAMELEVPLKVDVGVGLNWAVIH